MTKRSALFVLLTGLFILTVACQGAAPLETQTPSDTPGPTSVPTDAPFVAAGNDVTVALPVGNPERGETLVRANDCLHCHVGIPVGPLWAANVDQPGIGERAALRILQPDYQGSAATAEQYLFESIALPNVFVVDGYPAGLMPDSFGDFVSAQDMADMIAYLLTFR